jgi:8-oxo-dGTP pyrophosphatase MutT (NUDIX family)
MTSARPTQVVSAVIARAETVLLLRRRWNYPEIELGVGWWELPGGKREGGEAPFRALQRELEEEVALRLEPALCRSIGACSYALQKGKDRALREHEVFAVVAPDDWQLRLSSEHDQHAFVAAEDLGRIAIPELRLFLSKHLADGLGPAGRAS